MTFLAAPKGYQVYHGDFVSTEEGTGIVHIAPAFGEDDMRLAQTFDLPVLHPVKLMEHMMRAYHLARALG